MDVFLLGAMKSLMENSTDLFFVKNTNLLYQCASDSFAQLAGYMRGEQIIGKTDFELFDEELAIKYTTDDKLVIKEGAPTDDYVEEIPGKPGEKRYSVTSKYPVYDNNGVLIGVCGVGRDATAEVNLREERERRDQSRLMFEDILEADITEDKILMPEMTRCAKDMGVDGNTSFSEAIGTFAQKYIHPDYVKQFMSYYNVENLMKEYRAGVEAFNHISYQKVGENQYRWIEFCSRLYRSKVSKTVRIIVFLKDLDEEIRTKETLQKQARVDALTGLLNREAALNEINECLQEQPYGKFYLLLIDLDNFKEINDSMGHPFGDMVLQKIADNMRQIFRDRDILGRIGGDEFIVLLRGMPYRRTLESRMDQIFRAIGYCHKKGETKIVITCSIGISTHEYGKDFDQLYSEADKAMYIAKRRGKNSSAFYE